MGQSTIGVIMRCKAPHASIVCMSGPMSSISGRKRDSLTNSKTSIKLSGALPVMSICAVTVTWSSMGTAPNIRLDVIRGNADFELVVYLCYSSLLLDGIGHIHFVRFGSTEFWGFPPFLPIRERFEKVQYNLRTYIRTELFILESEKNKK
jgi:hypothetical protein